MMATTSAPVSLKEYFETSYEPECEYLDGELIPKAIGIDDVGTVAVAVCRRTPLDTYGNLLPGKTAEREADKLWVMATTSAFISLEEYFETLYEPECEYVDGELIPKAMGTNDHALLQARLTYLLYRYAVSGLCEVVTEQSVRVRQRAILIPDLCLLPPSHGERGVVSTPALVCIEILSPSDRFSYTVKKCEEYLRWGVPACWIFDPEEKKAWFYDAEGLHPVTSDGVLRSGSIELALKELWP